MACSSPAVRGEYQRFWQTRTGGKTSYFVLRTDYSFLSYPWEDEVFWW
ncbi:hypothetical protein H6G69_31815 [Nostoc sp. FACHB-110]|nr:hypothetical protein [Nostoc sp. FACHB-110]